MRLHLYFGRTTARGFAALLLPLLFLMLAACGRVEPTPFEIDSLVGKPAPDFALADFSGREHRLSSYKGRTVVLTFWASWTPVSRPHLDSLDAFHLNALKTDDGPVVLAVSADRSEQAARDFIRQRPLSFPLLFDEGSSVCRNTYKAFMVPTTIIIDAKGVIRHIRFGEQEFRDPAFRKMMDSVGRSSAP